MAEAERQKKSGGEGAPAKVVPDDGSGGDIGSKLRKLIEESEEDEAALTQGIREMMASWQGPIARLVLAKVFDEDKADKLWEDAFGAPELSPPPKDEEVDASPGAQLALAQAGELGAQLHGSLKQMSASPEAMMSPLHAAEPHVAAATMTRLHQQAFDGRRSAYQVLDELTQGGAKSLLAKGAVKDQKQNSAQKLDFRSGAAQAWASKIVAAMSAKGAIDSALHVAQNAPAWAAMRLALRQEPSVLPQVVQSLLDQVEELLRDVGSQEIIPDDLASRIAGVIGPVTARFRTGPEANAAAQAEGAAAVAVGEDVFVADGQFKPGTPEGDFLIAHELAHVAQAQQKTLNKAAPLAINSGRVVDEAEVEADLKARLVVARGNYDTTAPAAAAPGGFPESDGQREQEVAAQQQRIQVASQGAGTAAAEPATETPAEAPIVEEVAPKTPAPATAAAGSESAQAYTSTFAKSPSDHPTEWETAGDKASTALRSEEDRAVAEVPSFDAEMQGKDANAKGGDAGAGANAKVDAKGEGANPTATPPPMPTLPPATGNTEGVTRLASIGEDKARLKTEGLKAISQLQVKDDALKTNPGPSPVVELAGESDPVATKTAEMQARQQTEEELEKQRDKILSGPGPAQVQPIKIEEKLKLSAGDLQIGPMPTLPPVDGMALFKGWKSTADASLKGAFDEIARPKLDASVQPAKDKLMQSAEERDQTRQKLIGDAQAKTAQANAEAQSKQAQEVAGARSKIAAAQQNTLAKQKAAVAEVESKANTKRAQVTQQIDARVQADQQKIQGQYQEAQQQSEAEQRRGEEEARQKREEAERQANEGSWWDRAVNAISSAISAVAGAIDGILSAVAGAVGRIIDAVKDAACALIDAARSFINSAIAAFGSFLQDLVSATLGQVFPELAAALNSAIDGAVRAAQAAVNAIADGLKSAVSALLDGLKAGINAAINAFRAAVQVAAAFATALVTGDWEAVGRMLLEAALTLCGIDKAAFYALIGEARETIHIILDDPGAFASHVIDAVKQGFSQFGDNFLTHLRDGIVQWLFGTFAEAGITLPQRFDIAGVFDLVCQVLGLTYPRLRQKAVRLIGEQNVERIEFVWGYVQELLTNGWAGVWERVQNDLGNLWSTVIDGAKSWLLQHVVQAAIVRLATMFNPVGALVNLLMTAWNVYQWVKENAQRIFQLVQAVVQSMSEIAHGNIQNAANFIEGALARLVPIAISLLANLLGLGGIADRIREIIEQIQATVDAALDRLIDRVLAMFRGGGDKDKKEEGGEDVPASLVEPGTSKLDKLHDGAREQASKMPAEQVIFSKGGDAKEVTKQLLQTHSDAKFDKGSKQLTLPPVQPDALTSASSLDALGTTLAAQTGVSKIVAQKGAEKKLDIEGPVQLERSSDTQPFVFPVEQQIEIFGHINPSAKIISGAFVTGTTSLGTPVYLPIGQPIARVGNVVKLTPAGWNHILEGHVQSTFNISARRTKPVSYVFMGSPSEYADILEEGTQNAAVLSHLKRGEEDIDMIVRGQEMTLKFSFATGTIESFHGRGRVTRRFKKWVPGDPPP
jgi:hypothetical protein